MAPAKGRRSTNRLPRPGSLDPLTVPPKTSATRRTMARPRPTPDWPRRAPRRCGRRARRCAAAHRSTGRALVLHGHRDAISVAAQSDMNRGARRCTCRRCPAGCRAVGRAGEGGRGPMPVRWCRGPRAGPRGAGGWDQPRRWSRTQASSSIDWRSGRVASLSARAMNRSASMICRSRRASPWTSSRVRPVFRGGAVAAECDLDLAEHGRQGSS